MHPERHIRLFCNWHIQALPIPCEFHLQGNEAIILKEGERLIIEPIPYPSLLALTATWDSVAEEFPNVDEALTPLDDMA